MWNQTSGNEDLLVGAMVPVVPLTPMQMGALALDPDFLLWWYIVMQLCAMWLWS